MRLDSHSLSLGGSVVQQMGCHLVSSVLLDKPVPNYLSHNPRYKGVGVPTRLRKFEISIFTTSSTSPASTGTTVPFPPQRYAMTPLRPRRAQADVLIANARGTAVRPLIVSCYTATRRSLSHHEQLGSILCCCMVQKLVSSGWTFRETGHRSK